MMAGDNDNNTDLKDDVIDKEMKVDDIIDEEVESTHCEQLVKEINLAAVTNTKGPTGCQCN